MLISPRHSVKADCHSPHVSISRWTGGGSATALTKVFGRCVSTVTHRGADGKYRVNLGQVPAGTFLGLKVHIGTTTETPTGSKVGVEIAGSYSATNKLVDFLVTNLDSTPTAADLATTDVITIELMFAETAKP